MTDANYAAPEAGSKRATLWIGRVLSTIAVVLLIGSGVMKLTRPPGFVEAFGNKFGFPLSTLIPIGILELTCALLYAIPKTAVLGAILITGYLGGATVTHLRVSDPFLASLTVALLAWLGLYLREPRLRDLLPVRK